jgi:hypothetical protein
MALAKQIAIVGNGPSRNLYRPFRGDVCVCNIPQLSIEYDYISIVDRKAIDYIVKEDLRFEKPILTTDELTKFLKNTPCEAVFKEKLMNSAATAAYYFAQEYDVIWLYGCNALWSKDCSSSQDLLIPRPPRNQNLHNRWREKWKTVWATGKQFVIVCPNDTEEIDYGTNVCWNRANA